VASTLEFANGEHPPNLVEENDLIFYTFDDKVFKMGLNASSLPTAHIVSLSSQGIFGAYGFDVNDGIIYGVDAMYYTSNGKVHVFSTAGNLLESHTVGKLPNGFAFND